jgi:hypothetical protein
MMAVGKQKQWLFYPKSRSLHDLVCVHLFLSMKSLECWVKGLEKYNATKPY